MIHIRFVLIILCAIIAIVFANRCRKAVNEKRFGDASYLALIAIMAFMAVAP